MDNLVSSKNCVTEENEKGLDINVIRTAFMQVFDKYVYFLRSISRAIVGKRTNDVEREKRKFNAVRKELFNYLFVHRMFFTVKAIQLLSNNRSLLYTLTLDNSDNYENLLNLDDVSELDLKVDSFKDFHIMRYVVPQFKETIISRIKIVLNKLVISDEDIQLLLQHHYLVDKNDLKSNCSNYRELQTYIHSRAENYCRRTVSTGHINRMSFKFQGSIKDYEDKKSCCVCLEDYEIDQEICHLPCNHFCCRSCTEGMFAVPEDGSRANFQCPICRADCT